MIEEAKRRGRPPLSDNAAPKHDTGETTTPSRRRRLSVGGHALRLLAPVKEGFMRRWVNDVRDNVANRQELAYDIVSDPSIKTTDAGSHVSRIVGTHANGEPLRAYLMETPEEEYRAGEIEKEAFSAHIDDAINRGADSTGQLGSSSETYGHGSIKRGR